LTKVMPSTVGDTDGVVLGADDVVPPPGGGLVGLPLAGHALLLGDVVGNCVVLSGAVATPPAKGTMTMPSVATAAGQLDCLVLAFGEGLASASALIAKAVDAPIAIPALNVNTAIRSLVRGALRQPTSSLAAATSVPFSARGWCAHAPRGAAPAPSQGARSASRS
jgi:hypothetical protein